MDTITKKCKECGKDKPLAEYGEDKRANDGHASVCLSCKSKSKANLDEKLDRVVDSMSGAVHDLNQRVTSVEENVTSMKDSIDQVLGAIKAINQPTQLGQFNDFEDGADVHGNVDIEDDKNGEHIIIETSKASVDDPMFKEKADLEMFMNEWVDVYVNESSDPNADQVFPISVNGETEIFARAQKKRVKRKFVEGLARCRPINYRNQETKDKDGHPKYVHPFSRGARFGFSVQNDSRRGNDWLARLRQEP